MAKDENTNIIYLITGLRDIFLTEVERSYLGIGNLTLRPAEGALLCHLKVGQKKTLNAIAEGLMRDPSSISPVIKSLENNGYILRKTDTIDARVNFISLTEKGKAMRQRALRATRKLYIRLFRGIDEQERK
ncbi:MAG: MarR family winged helix-turn-helix transcriptional regulator, partial [Leptospira sp.]|nr:MarR family winged helix-turn-helix transcriptional regulator [Leptospira sp.]